ncbi:MAG: SusC/RagA family TonB-linked outer membrane protein, partial [Bacteroidota bacterium]
TAGRQDWFSALDGRSIFYPSVGASFVFSELIDVPVMNFAKVRGSWAQLTNDPSQFAYQTSLYYNLSGSANGFPLGQISNGAIPNANLKPNTLVETEFGLEFKFLDNRIGLDVAYYNKKTTDEPINITTSFTSGYTSASLNVGSLENKGIELLLTGTPVKSQDFTWNISFNFTRNNNKVVKLNEGLNSIGIATSRSLNAFAQHVVGEPASQVRAFDYSRDANGAIIHDANGFPVQGELKSYGSGHHPNFGGVNNEFNYKGVNFSFKSGGKIFSATDYYAYIFGLHKNTLVGRNEDIISAGVNASGAANTVPVKSWDYYGGGSGIANRISSLFVYDASFVKLRQIVLGYTLPASIFKSGVIQSVNVSFVARNVAILKKNTPNIDPESNLNNGVGQGLELAGVPPTRSYGFNLNVKF